MGFRYRKSIKLGGARLNLSKSGIGYSVGTKGFRVTKKAGGGTRTTTSIPGTGISYVKDSKTKKRWINMKTDNVIGPTTDYSSDYGKHKDNNSRPVTKTELILAWFLGFFGAHKFYRKKYGMGILYIFTFGLFVIGWLGDAISLTLQYFSAQKGRTIGKPQKVCSYIAALLCVSVLGSCGSNNPTPAAPETEPTIVTIAAETTEETEATTETTNAPSVDTQSTTVLTAPETTAPTVPETTVPTVPETAAPTSAPVYVEPVQPQEEMVWIPTNGGTKYHSRSSCSNMDNPQQVTVSQAESRGFTPCKKCH